MKKLILSALVFLIPFLSLAQNNLADANGDFNGEFTINKKFLDYESAYPDNWLKNINPGIIPEGDYLGQAVFTPDGQKIFLTNRLTDLVTVYDWETMSVLANINVGVYPSCLDATNEYVVIGCQFSDHVYIIDAINYTIVDSLSTFEQPCKIHIDSINNKAFVACDIDNVCLVIDLQSFTVIDTIQDFPIYLQTYSWSTQSARNWIKYSDFLISPNGDGLIIHNGQDKLMYFDITTSTVTKQVTVLSPRGIAFSGDDSVIVCAANPNNIARLYQINYATFTIQDSVDVAGNYLARNDVVVNQDGTKAYVGTGNNTSTLIKFPTHDFISFASTYTAFWLGVSADHRYVISGQNRFSIVDFETESITDQYLGLNQSWGVVSPINNHVFSYDPLLFEGTYYFDFSDPDDIQYRGYTLSGEVPEGDAPYRVAMVPDDTRAVVINNSFIQLFCYRLHY